MRLRTLKNGLFRLFCLTATLLGLSVLILILFTLLQKGLAGLSWTLFSQVTPGPGGEGGLANALLGSLMMTGLAIVLATPVGVLAGTWLAEYGQQRKAAELIRFLNGSLMSAPSILVGLFVYQMMVVPMGHFSGWAGAVALAIIALPVIISTTEEMLKLVPRHLREAGAGLGAPRWLIIVKLGYRAVGTGMLTGILLSVARISGETAPLLFTALNSSFMTLNPNEPMANLPVTIYQFAMSPYDSWNQLAWAGALLITLAILALNVLSRLLPHLQQRRKP